MMQFYYHKCCCFSLIFSLSYILACSSYTKLAIKDQVHELPGATTPLLSNHFSGFLDISDDKFIHYMYVESERDPSKDSIIFWTNGGPGCSGLLGMFTEMGPWRPIAHKKLERNQFSWTTVAGMIFLEQPAGVGFSYSTDTSIYTSFNDYRASRDNLLIIQKFFEKFPERRGQDFYIASESYGGHFIPQWTLQLFDQHDHNLIQNFKGYIVGNPYTSFASGSIAMANILWGLQLIPKPAWDLMVESTCDSLYHNAYHFAEYLPQCFAYLEALFEFADELNPYALEFPVCPISVPLRHNLLKFSVLSTSSQAKTHWATMFKKINALLKRKSNDSYHQYYERMKFHLSGNFGHDSFKRIFATGVGDDDLAGPPRDIRALHYDPCTEHFTDEYLRDPDVQIGLHVSPDFRNGESEWGFCDDKVNGNWALSDYFADTTPLYSKIYNHPNKPEGFKMLVFSGDSDGVCATVGTQNWIYDIQNAEVRSLFKPWYYEDLMYGRQPAGFLTQFTGRLTFATVHFAGHEVPAYQPEKALELLNGYLNGSIFWDIDGVIDHHSTENASNYDANGKKLALLLAWALVITATVGIIVCFSPRSSSHSDNFNKI